MRRRALALGPLLASLATPAEAASDHDAGLWLVNQLTTPLHERVSFHFMLQNRWTRDDDRYGRSVIRPFVVDTPSLGELWRVGGSLGASP